MKFLTKHSQEWLSNLNHNKGQYIYNFICPICLVSILSTEFFLVQKGCM